MANPRGGAALTPWVQRTHSPVRFSVLAVGRPRSLNCTSHPGGAGLGSAATVAAELGRWHAALSCASATQNGLGVGTESPLSVSGTER